MDSHDVAIGPSADGGYYLAGFKKESFLGGVFDNISWSSDSVFTQTISFLKKCQHKVSILQQWWDIDTAKDLELFNQRKIQNQST